LQPPLSRRPQPDVRRRPATGRETDLDHVLDGIRGREVERHGAEIDGEPAARAANDEPPEAAHRARIVEELPPTARHRLERAGRDYRRVDLVVVLNGDAEVRGGEVG